MLPPRCLLFPHQSLQWPHLTTLLNELIASTPPEDLIAPLSLSLEELGDQTHTLLCVEATTIEEVAAWAELLHAHALTARVILSPELASAFRLQDLYGLGLAPTFHLDATRPLIELDTRARQAQLHALRDVTPQGMPPTLAIRPNSYGVALDDLLVEQCARIANLRHFILPELHPPISLLAIRDRHTHTSRAHHVTQGDVASFLRAWLDGDAIATAHSAARKVAGKLFHGLARRRHN